MRIDEAKEVLKFIMQNGEVPVLVGEAGIGKTEIIKRIGAETNRNVIILMLSQMEPGDLLGLPSRDEKNQKTIYYKPDWWPESGDTIIFLDEINRAHISVRNAVMQLLLDKRIHNNVLPEGTWLVAAMNPETDNYEVEQIMDQAFMDRFVWIKVINPLPDWIKFMAATKRAHFDYLTAIENVYKVGSQAFETDDFSLPELRPTPRALERLGKLLVNCPNHLKQYLNELSLGIVGKIGPKIIQEYFNSIKTELTYTDLLTGNTVAVEKANSATRVQVLDSLLTYLLTKYDEANKTLDIDNTTLENITKCLELYKKEELGPLYRFAQEKYRQIILTMKKQSPAFAQFFRKLVNEIGFKDAILKMQ